MVKRRPHRAKRGQIKRADEGGRAGERAGRATKPKRIRFYISRSRQKTRDPKQPLLVPHKAALAHACTHARKKKEEQNSGSPKLPS